MARRKPEYSTDSKHFYDWLDRAGEDITCAKLLLADEDCYNGAAFHCQQTVEKALKAYILLKSDTLVDGHNLPWLCKRAARYDKAFNQWLDESSSLNRCYIETRYPADIPLEFDGERINNYYNMANTMYQFICGEVEQILQSNSAHPKQRTED